jgi:hypothetical protein
MSDDARLCDTLDVEGAGMKVEDEYLDVLQNIEFGIIRVFRADSFFAGPGRQGRRGGACPSLSG